MPRKKLSLNDRSTEDEGYSEEIESDLSSELNSRRNTFRKKPQRKCSFKENRNKSILKQTKGREEKSQDNYSDKNKKRPSIIKIFRRIDRKAKNIYLVDDKIEHRNELESLKSKTSHSLQHTNDKKSLFNSCASKRPFRTFTEHSTTNVKSNLREHDFEDVNVHTPPDGHADSHLSKKSIIQTINKDKIDLCYKLHSLQESQSSVKIIKETTDETDVWNLPHVIRDLHSLDTAERVDVWNHPCDNLNLYSPVTDTTETLERNDVWKETHDLYSPVTDIVETPEIVDVWNLPHVIRNLYSPVTDTTEILEANDVWKETRDLYSPVTDISETFDTENVWKQNRDSADLYSSVTDIIETPGRSDVWNQTRNTNDSYPSETDIDLVLDTTDVCSQLQSGDFDAPDSTVTGIEQIYMKTGAFNLLKSDL